MTYSLRHKMTRCQGRGGISSWDETSEEVEGEDITRHSTIVEYSRQDAKNELLSAAARPGLSTMPVVAHQSRID